MNIKSAGKTDIGLVRKGNEDSIRLIPESRLFIVCDGMGGHNAGEVASKTACELVATLYQGNYDRVLEDERLRLPRLFPPSTDVLIKAVRIANHAIFKKAQDDPSKSGMGTTIVAAAIEEDIITILHVGDSRIYHLANKKLQALTIDHSWAAELEQAENISADEAKGLVNRNVITRALGIRSAVDIDVSVHKIKEDDIFILVSDGLCGFVDDADIQDAVIECGENVQSITDQLINLALHRGGTDNVSVIAFQVCGKINPSQLSAMETVTVSAESSELFAPEEEWSESAVHESETQIIVNDQPDSKKSPFMIIATIVVIIAIMALFYVILIDPS